MYYVSSVNARQQTTIGARRPAPGAPGFAGRGVPSLYAHAPLLHAPTVGRLTDDDGIKYTRTQLSGTPQMRAPKCSTVRHAACVGCGHQASSCEIMWRMCDVAMCDVAKWPCGHIRAHPVSSHLACSSAAVPVSPTPSCPPSRTLSLAFTSRLRVWLHAQGRWRVFLSRRSAPQSVRGV